MAAQLYAHQSDGEYRLLAKNGLGALIFSRPDYAATAKEHEHPEAQISVLFGGNAPSLAWQLYRPDDANAPQRGVVHLYTFRAVSSVALERRRFAR